MKIKRFMAGLLCAAMVITSQGVPVGASELELGDTTVVEGLADENVYEPAAGEQPVEDDMEMTGDVSDSKEDPVDAGTVSGSEVPDDTEGSKDSVITGEDTDVTPEGALDPTDCFEVYIKDGKKVLGLKSNYNSLYDTGYVNFSIPADVEVIPKDTRLFYMNSKVETVDFVTGGSGTLTIEEGAFADSSIETFIAPRNYYRIENGVFSGCTKLKTFSFNDIEYIGNNAFDGCIALGGGTGSVSWGNRISNIGSYAFRNTGFAFLDISSMTSQYDDVTIGDHAFSGCTNLTGMNIPGSVSLIPDYCFSDCTKLESIDILASNEGTVIGKYAFWNCTKLTEIKKGVLNVVEIGENAFSGCRALKSVDLPKSVIKIGERAFDVCTSLATVIIRYQNDKGFADEVLEIHDNAFPTYKSITISGYDGVVKKFALDKDHPFKAFKTLFEALTITGSKDKGFVVGQQISTDQPGNKAVPGTKVKLYVTPKADNSGKLWRLQRDGLKDEAGGLKNSDFKFTAGNNEKQTFEFEMPYNNVIVGAAKNFYFDSDLNGATYNPGIAKYDDDNGLKFIKKDNVFVVDRPGYKGRIQIDATGKTGTVYNIGEWMFEYQSSNTSVVTVSPTGVVSSIGPGDAKVTATYRGSSTKVVLDIHVGPAPEIYNLELSSANEKYPVVDVVERKYKDVEYLVPVIEINKNYVKSESLSFDARLYARESETDTESYYIKANWASKDTKVVSLGSTTTSDNVNKLTINKGAEGETEISASYATSRLDEDGKKITLYAYMIIRVVDMTPRVNVGSIVVDINKDEDAFGGTAIKIKPYRNRDIDTAYAPSMWRGNTPVAYDGLKVKWDGGEDYRLIVNKNGSEAGIESGKSKSYSGNNRLYIRMRYTDEDVDYYVPLDKVVVENKFLELKTTASGTINLFYNSSCYDPLSIDGHEAELARASVNETDEDYIERYINATVGAVKVGNNISKATAEVTHAQLWSKTRYNKWRADKTLEFPDDDTDDSLSNNFDIAVDRINTQNLVIRRSDNALWLEKKTVPVTDGYLAVYFKGYTRPLIQQIKVPTKKAAPSYALSPASVTDNKLNRGGSYVFKIMNNKTKKVVVSANSLSNVWLEHTREFDSVSNSGELFTLVSKTNEGKKTALVNVRRSNWDSESKVQYKYTVNYVDKAPTAKVTPGTATLNTAFDGTPAEIKLELNEVNCVLTLDDDVDGTGETFPYAGSAAKEYEASKLTIDAVDDPDGVTSKKIITVTFDPADKPAPGSYKFAFIPKYNWMASTSQMKTDAPLKKMFFTVKVIENSPQLKLSGPSYTFNMYFPEKELWESTATFKDLPTGLKLEDVDPLLDTSNPEWRLTAKDVTKADPYGIADDVADAVKIDHYYDTDKKKEFLTFVADESAFDSYSKFSFTYYLNGITIDGIRIKEDSLKVTIKGSTASASVTVSAKDSINTIDYTTKVKYTAKFKGINNPVISNVRIIDETTGVESDELEARPDPKLKNVYYVYATHPSDIELPNLKHDFRLYYDIMSDDQLDPQTGRLSIKPVQKVPTLKMDIKKAVFYKGVNDEERIVTIGITKTGQLKTHIVGFKLKDSNGELNDWFAVESYEDQDDMAHEYTDLTKYDKELKAGDLIIKCTAPEKLENGKVYNLVLEAEFDGQFVKRNSYGEMVDKKGNVIYDYDEAIKTGGSTITVPVVVYK